MKILQISYSLASGGAERFVVDLSNQLSMENDIYLLTIDDDRYLKNRYYLSNVSRRVNYINLHCKSGLSIKSFIKVFKAIWSINPEIVHAHCSVLLLLLPSFVLTKSIYIHTLHNIAEVCLPFKWMRKILKYVYGRGKIVPVVISKSCLDSYRKLYNLSNANLINNGRLKPKITELKDQVMTEIESYKINSDDKVFIHIARYSPQKNQSLLLSCFLEILNKGKHVILIVIGRDFDKMNFKNKNQNSGVYFLGEKSNIADYLVCSDFFILSSLYEGLPLSLLEALSYGVTPVCTSVGGIPDVVIDEVTGFLSPSLERDDFIMTLERALYISLKKSKEELIQYYYNNYKMDVCACKYLNLYKMLDEKNNRKR